MNAHDKQDYELAQQIVKNPTFKENVGKYGVYGAVVLALSSNSAFALDTAGIVSKVEEAGTATDTIGLALIGVVVGIAIIFMVIGMLRRA